MTTIQAQDAPAFVAAAVQDAHDAKVAAEAAEAKAAEAKEYALTVLRKEKITTLVLDDDGARVKATVVNPTTSTVDYAKLATLLTEDQWESIIERKVSKSLLTEAIDAGVIDPDIVTSCTRFGEGTPHIRWSAKVIKGLKRWTRPEPKARRVAKKAA